MKTEGKGSETHLQKAGLQMNTFTLTFSYSLSSLQKKRQPERDERKRDDCVLVLSQPLLPFPGLFQSNHCCWRLLITSPCHFTGIFLLLDLHVNFLESKSFICHIHSLQHILMITLCLNFLNYSMSPYFPPSLWAGKCILLFNCIQH